MDGDQICEDAAASSPVGVAFPEVRSYRAKRNKHSPCRFRGVLPLPGYVGLRQPGVIRTDASGAKPVVLATKDLLGVEQDIPYGSITITVK